jgi:hypothetical protein
LLVALVPVRDLLLCAKHLFAASMVVPGRWSDLVGEGTAHRREVGSPEPAHFFRDGDRAGVRHHAAQAHRAGNQRRIITSVTADEMKFTNPRTPAGVTLEFVWKRAK